MTPASAHAATQRASGRHQGHRQVENIGHDRTSLETPKRRYRITADIGASGVRTESLTKRIEYGPQCQGRKRVVVGHALREMASLIPAGKRRFAAPHQLCNACHTTNPASNRSAHTGPAGSVAVDSPLQSSLSPRTKIGQSPIAYPERRDCAQSTHYTQGPWASNRLRPCTSGIWSGVRPGQVDQS
jgi:hypothetical protein